MKITKWMLFKARVRRIFRRIASAIRFVFLKFNHSRNPLKVVDMISYEEAENMPETPLGGMGGWFGWKQPNRWADYRNSLYAESAMYADAFKEFMIENEIRITGEDHQNRDGVPVFSNGKVAMFSYRAWGDIMAAVWSDIDDKDYTYMEFYM